MIESIVITIAANYVIFTLGMFSVVCKHWLNLAELHHKHTSEFELQQAEAIIREEAVNLAREIENLTKKETPRAVNISQIKRAVIGFENRGEIFAVTTGFCSPLTMRMLEKDRVLESPN